jgi:hypothetical protein
MNLRFRCSSVRKSEPPLAGRCGASGWNPMLGALVGPRSPSIRQDLAFSWFRPRRSVSRGHRGSATNWQQHPRRQRSVRALPRWLFLAALIEIVDCHAAPAIQRLSRLLDGCAWEAERPAFGVNIVRCGADGSVVGRRVCLFRRRLSRLIDPSVVPYHVAIELQSYAQ